jgi:hypothetical protein
MAFIAVDLAFDDRHGVSALRACVKKLFYLIDGTILDDKRARF